MSNKKYINVYSLYFYTGDKIPNYIQMLVITRKLMQKGNSFYINVPKKDMVGDEVILLDREAYNDLLKR